MNNKLLIAANFFYKPNIVVWGCGKNGEALLKRFPWLADRITEFVDSSFNKIGERFLDKWEIKAPIFLNPDIHNVIVTPHNSKEIVEHLEKKSFIYNNNCIFFEDLIDPDILVVANRVEQYKKSHPEICILTCSPLDFPHQYLSSNEQYIIDNKIHYWTVRNDPSASPVLSKYFSSPEEILESITPPKSYYDIYGVRKFEDTQGKIVNTSNGHRITTEQPKKYKRTIFVVGGCPVFGVGASDQGTMCSNLQRLFNKCAPECGIIVENYGYYLSNGANEEEFVFCTKDMINILEFLPIKSGDIVLCQIVDTCHDINLSKAATHPHNYGELFWDCAHNTENAYRLMANKIFEYLKEHEFFNGNNIVKSTEATSFDNDGLQITDENTIIKLKEYKDELTKYKPRTGAIVMNCNPFTFGHRYLIEQAAAQVTQLFIFVVQEDKSFFPFEDRIALVKEGVKDLPNVTAIPSGQFIISTLTFKEYFNKSELQDRTIDSSMDVNLFGQEIAPCLGITVRFIGEEPFDVVTNQYNETMKTILPQYGIEVVEMPRKEHSGEAISASRVRILLKEKKFDKIKQLVPQTTLKYLKEKFG